jgi:hypothetical protein
MVFDACAKKVGHGPRVTLGVFAACLFLSMKALAGEPSSQDRETARRLMDLGDAKSAANDPVGASAAYEKAHAIMHVPTTGFELARAYERSGRLVDARDRALEVVRMPKDANEPEVFAKARQEAAVLANALLARVATLTIEVVGPPPGVPVTIAVDGRPIPFAAHGVGFAADPGKHQVQASAPGYRKAETEVNAGEGGQVPVSLKLEPSNDPPPQNEKPSDNGHVSVLTIALLSAGGVGLGVGAVSGILALGKTNTLKDACPNNRCGPEQNSAYSTVRTLSWVSNVGFGVGIVAAGVGTYLLISDLGSRSKASSARTVPLVSVTPTGATLGIAGAL